MLVQCASPGEEGNWLVYASVCVICWVKEGLSGSEQLIGYFYSGPSQGVAYCMAKPDWHLFSAS